jgi:hypothetical protein
MAAFFISRGARQALLYLARPRQLSYGIHSFIGRKHFTKIDGQNATSREVVHELDKRCKHLLT